MTDNEITKEIVDSAYKIPTKLGPGLLESVYETVLAWELEQRRLAVQRQIDVPIAYEHLKFDTGFRADLIVNNQVIVEIKAIQQVVNVHKKQLLTYLRLAGKRVGLLINFNETLIKNGIHRIANRATDPVS